MRIGKCKKCGYELVRFIQYSTSYVKYCLRCKEYTIVKGGKRKDAKLV